MWVLLKIARDTGMHTCSVFVNRDRAPSVRDGEDGCERNYGKCKYKRGKSVERCVRKLATDTVPWYLTLWDLWRNPWTVFSDFLLRTKKGEGKLFSCWLQSLLVKLGTWTLPQIQVVHVWGMCHQRRAEFFRRCHVAASEKPRARSKWYVALVRGEGTVRLRLHGADRSPLCHWLSQQALKQQGGKEDFEVAYEKYPIYLTTLSSKK